MENIPTNLRELEELHKKTAVSDDDLKTSEYPKIKLSQLIKTVIDTKALAMYPNSTALARDKLYNHLTYLENQLVELKDVNVELERGWWKE